MIGLHAATLWREGDIRERDGELREVCCECWIFGHEPPYLACRLFRHRLGGGNDDDKTAVAADECPDGGNLEPGRLALAARPAHVPVAAELDGLFERLDEPFHALRRAALDHLVRAETVVKSELQQ